MELYILDKTYNIIGLVDKAESVLWNKKYNDVGECEIYVPCSDVYLELLQRGYYVYRFDDDMLCKIENVELTTDENNGDFLTATATDACKILSGRIIRWLTVYSGTVAGFIKRLLLDNVINPAQAQRKIPNFVIDESNFSELTETINVTTSTDDLLQLIISTCKAYGYGFRLSFDRDRGQLVFRLYKGKNKAATVGARTATGEEYVEFSPAFGNITSSAYKESEGEYKNLAYVGYVGKDDSVSLLSLYDGDTEPTGEARQEIYVDGTGTTRDITYEELLSLFPAAQKGEGVYYIVEDGSRINVATYDASTATETQVIITDYARERINYVHGGDYFGDTAPLSVVLGVFDLYSPVTEDNMIYIEIDGERIVLGTIVPSTEKVTATDYAYIMLIRRLGINALAEHRKTQEFIGAVDVTDSYLYKTDYDLGDTVKVRNDYGKTADAQIVEIMESVDASNNRTVEPTFEYFN